MQVILGCAGGVVAAAALLVAAVVFLGLQLNFQGIFSPVVPAGSRSDDGGGGSGGGGGQGGGGSGGGGAGGAGNGGFCAWGDYRLPDVVVPHSYNLTIEADLQTPRQAKSRSDAISSLHAVKVLCHGAVHSQAPCRNLALPSFMCLSLSLGEVVLHDPCRL